MRALTAVLSLCPETLAQEREWQGRAARASWAVGRVDCTICIARRTLACQTGRLRSADPTNRFPHGLTDQRLAQSTPRGGADPAGGVMWPVRGREARPASGRGAPARDSSHPCWRPRAPPRSTPAAGPAPRRGHPRQAAPLADGPAHARDAAAPVLHRRDRAGILLSWGGAAGGYCAGPGVFSYGAPVPRPGAGPRVLGANTAPVGPGNPVPLGVGGRGGAGGWRSRGGARGGRGGGAGEGAAGAYLGEDAVAEAQEIHLDLDRLLRHPHQKKETPASFTHDDVINVEVMRCVDSPSVPPSLPLSPPGPLPPFLSLCVSIASRAGLGLL